jgi:Putative zinc-finger
MLNNNHKNSACAFAEPLISYLYGEIGNPEKAEFEAHLKDCAACENELAEFGFARTAVQEWKISEFDVLPTPIFEIPSNTAKTRLIAESSVSWLENFNRIFSFKPALAMSALAVLIVFAGITFLTFSLSDNNQIAGKTDVQDVVSTVVTPTIEKINEQSKQFNDKNSVAVNDKNIVPSETKAKNLPVAVSGIKSAVPNDSTVKVSINTPKNNSVNDAPLPDIKAVNRPNKKSTVVRKSRVPSLTEAEETEDNSVRLADLFDELDTK